MDNFDKFIIGLGTTCILLLVFLFYMDGKVSQQLIKEQTGKDVSKIEAIFYPDSYFTKVELTGE